jgi:protein-export membrane protein SecD
MQSRTLTAFVGVILLAAVALYFAYPHVGGLNVAGNNFDYRRGLDLQGGLRVVLASDLPGGQVPNDDQMETAKLIIERRVNGLGVSEPVVQRVGTDKILVELPGVADPDQAVEAFGSTGLLEFVDAGQFPLEFGQRINTSNTITEDPNAPYLETILTGQELDPARVALQFEQTTNDPVIAFGFQGDARTVLENYTAANVGNYMAIVVDNIVVSSPVINSVIPGEGIIQGSFTLEEAEALVLQLRYGSLPVPLQVIENRTVGATLGADSVSASLLAGTIGLIAVAIYMIVYYRLPGILAVGALMIYIALSLAIFKLIPVTLTLAGIAGFLLSVGMAVDANVLIFERMKEELRDGKSLRAAVRAGFHRAWSSIRDSNASTLITCVILYLFGANFGASIVQGFAVTLAVGVLVSLFTAITITRTFMDVVMESNAVQNKWWFGI